MVHGTQTEEDKGGKRENGQMASLIWDAKSEGGSWCMHIKDP